MYFTTYFTGGLCIWPFFSACEDPIGIHLAGYFGLLPRCLVLQVADFQVSVGGFLYGVASVLRRLAVPNGVDCLRVGDGTALLNALRVSQAARFRVDLHCFGAIVDACRSFGSFTNFLNGFVVYRRGAVELFNAAPRAAAGLVRL